MKSILMIKAIVSTLIIFSIIGCGGGSTSEDSSISSSNFQIASEKQPVSYDSVSTIIKSSVSLSGEELQAKLKSIPFWYRVIIENGKEQLYYIRFVTDSEKGEEYTWFKQNAQGSGEFVDGGSIKYGHL